MVDILDIDGYTFDKEVLRLAVEEYVKFRGTDEHTEDYKWEIFKDLNKWLDENELNEENILDFVNFLKEKNPNTGSFTHWSDLDDIAKFTEENIEKTLDLFKELYYGKDDLEDRISKFRDEIKIGTPAFGYLLAAFNYEKYAPIKVGLFKKFMDHFVDMTPKNIGSFSIDKKYSFYVLFCEKIGEFLEEEGVIEKATALAAQDFYYTIEAYEDIKLESIFLKYIWNFDQKFSEFKKDSELLIREIATLPTDFLQEKRDFCANDEKINKIRYITLDKLIKEEDVDIEKIATDVNSDYEKNILQNWTNFTIHSQIYYDFFKYRLSRYFESISEFLTSNIDIESLDSNIVTFQGSRNRPTVEPYILIYPEEKGSHRDSYQFFFRVLPKKIEYGLSHGENIDDSEFKEKYVGEINEVDENSLKRIVERYNQIIDEFKELNQLDLEVDDDIRWYIDKYKELHDWKSDLEKRKKFQDKYRKIFDPDNIDELDKEDVFSFLKESFWPGLERSKNKITEDMEKLRKSIEYLLDDNEDLIERLNNIVDNSKSEYWIRGMGRNLSTGIIKLMDESDEYGVFNERATTAMKKLGIYPDDITSSMSTGEKYVKINEVLKKLNNMGLEGMWDVDYFVYWLDENYEKLAKKKQKHKEIDIPAEIEEIFNEVFKDKRLIVPAFNHFKLVFNEIKGKKDIGDKVATTWRKSDDMISINIGNWKIFSIARDQDQYQCAIAADLDVLYEEYDSWPEFIEEYREFKVGKNHKLIKFEWHPDIFEKHSSLKEAMKNSTNYAFDYFNSSAYTNHQHEGLFEFFTDKDYEQPIPEDIHAVEEETNYFWVTANPSIWRVSKIEDGKSVFYNAYNRKGNKKRIFESFEKAKAGDKVLFYESTPVKKIVAEGEIEKGMHYKKQEGFDEATKGISIKYCEPINDISWKEITDVSKLEDSAPVKNSARGSIFEISKDEYDAILSLEENIQEIERTKEEILLEKNNAELEFEDIDFTEGLHFPKKTRRDIIQSVKAALKSGKNIILTGPPGTGKTKIARNIAKLMEDNCECVDGFTFTTATADWTTFDTMGGYHPHKEDGSLCFKPGLFLKCFKEDFKPVNKWLIIDEINRADIDKAFGQLFSVLSKDDVELPFTDESERSISVVSINEKNDEIEYKDNNYYVTRNWRLLATMNTYDKASLYEMSYAFMRRFAFIDVGVPMEQISDDLIIEYIKKWDDLEVDEVENYLDNLSRVWKVLNDGKRSIGPAIIKDMLLFLKESGDGEGLVNALKLYVLPQMEGMIKSDQEKIFQDLIQEIGHQDEIKKVAKERFELILKEKKEGE